MNVSVEAGSEKASCDTVGSISIPRGGKGVMVGTRNDELGRFFKGDVGELIVYPRALTVGYSSRVVDECCSLDTFFLCTL